MPSADFTINGFSTSQDVSPSATVTLALVSTSGVNRVEWFIRGKARSAHGTPTFSLSGSPNGAQAQITVGSQLGQGYLIECRIEGGVDTVGDPISTYTVRKTVFVLNGAGRRALIYSENLETDASVGQYDRLNDAIDAFSATGSDWKESVVAATTGNLTATRSSNVLTETGNGALAAQDGISLSVSDRLLVKNQATGADNGIYVVTSLGSAGTPYVLTRAGDADSSAEVTSQMKVPVARGTVSGGYVYRLATNDPITLNSTSLQFIQDIGLGTGGANQVIWSDGTTPQWTGAPIFTSLTLSSFVAIGSPAAAAGSLRIANNTKASWRNAANSADIEGVYVDGSNQVWLSAVGTGGTNAIVNAAASNSVLLAVNSSTKLSIGASITSFVASVLWDAAVASPTLSQNTQASDIATQAMTIAGQSAFASATGTNKNVKDLTIKVGVPASGGTDAQILLLCGTASSVHCRIGYPSAPTNYSAIYFLPAATASTANNYTFLSDGTSLTALNAPGGVVSIAVANVGVVQWNNTGTYTFAESMTPIVQQSTRTSDSSNHDFTIAAQSAFASATGANRNAGHLLLKGGVKATGGTDGEVRIFSGSTEYLRTDTVNANVLIQNGLAFPETGSTATLKLYARTSDAATGVLTIQGQDAFASATGANRNGGRVNIKGGGKATGGTPGTVRILDGDNNTIFEAAGAGANTVQFFGAGGAGKQTFGAATAGGTYGAGEQTMLQKAYDAFRNFGLAT